MMGLLTKFKNKKKDKPFLLVDFDNTLVDSVKQLYDKIYSRYGYYLSPNECFSYDIKEHFKREGIPESLHDEWLEIFNEKDFYRGIALSSQFYTIFNLVNTIYADEYCTVLHTNCANKKIAKAKKRQLERYGFNFDKMYFDRKDILKKKFEYDIIIEDCPYVIENFLTTNPSGLAYVPKKPYNINLTHSNIIFI